MRITTLVASVSLCTTLGAMTAAAQESPGLATVDKRSLFDTAAKTKVGFIGCVATGGFMNMAKDNGGFSVIVEGPVGRVARAMTEAKKMYKPFSVDSITDEMAVASVTVTVIPAKPEFGPTHLSYVKTDDGAPAWHLAPLAKHVVLKSRPKKGQELHVLQPTDVEVVPVTWSNAMGGTFSGQGVVGRFDLDPFRTLAADDLDVAIISDIEAERGCKVGKSDLAKVR